MAFVVVGGVQVSVTIHGGARETIEEVGRRRRAFDGSMLSTIRARKRVWPLRTTPLTTAAAATLRAALVGTPPVSCSGDLLGGTVSCHPEFHGSDPVKVANGHRLVLDFTLHEA